MTLNSHTYMYYTRKGNAVHLCHVATYAKVRKSLIMMSVWSGEKTSFVGSGLTEIFLVATTLFVVNVRPVIIKLSLLVTIRS